MQNFRKLGSRINICPKKFGFFAFNKIYLNGRRHAGQWAHECFGAGEDEQCGQAKQEGAQERGGQVKPLVVRRAGGEPEHQGAQEGEEEGDQLEKYCFRIILSKNLKKN